jgi:hypothetical protein
LSTTQNYKRVALAIVGGSLLAYPAMAQTTDASMKASFEFVGSSFFYAMGVLVFLYAAAALATPKNAHGQSRWNPLVITAGKNGRSSLSRLQVFYFTLIVVAALTYILVNTRELDGLSKDVLMLLGISAVGAAGGQVVAVTRKRLSSENWSWLIRKQWITESIERESRPASPADLVTSDDQFDIYKFQMLAFSLIVGMALIAKTFEKDATLANFTISASLLGVLGLSQVVYLGGKTAGPPTNQNLNAALDSVRKLELAFVKAVADKWDLKPPVASDIDSQEKRMSAAIVVATGEYNEYMAAAENAARLVQERIGAANPTENTAPTLFPRVVPSAQA